MALAPASSSLLLPILTILLALIATSSSSSTRPFGSAKKDVRARYPSLYLLQESQKMPQPTPRPQKSTRHVAIPKERSKGRNAVVELSNDDFRRGKPVSARYKSIFGHSKPQRGTEFTPENIVQFTGKLAQSRRQTFKWSPSGSTADYFLFPGRH